MKRGMIPGLKRSIDAPSMAIQLMHYRITAAVKLMQTLICFRSRITVMQINEFWSLWDITYREVMVHYIQGRPGQQKKLTFFLQNHNHNQIIIFKSAF